MTGDAGLTLLTGATGFLGRAVLRRLRGRPGHRVLACVRRPAALAGQVDTCAVDLTATDAVRRLRAVLAGTGAVRLVHLAGGYPAGAEELLTSANVGSTTALLEACGDRLVRVVHASSVAVYGSHRQRYLGGQLQVAPDTAYGRAKWLAEAALELFAQHTDVPVVSMRLASLYGPGNTGRNAVAMLTAAIARRRPFVVDPAVPVHARDYVYVDDAAQAVLAALDSGLRGVVDVGSGTATSPYDLVDVVRATGEAVEVRTPDGDGVTAPGAVGSRFACDPSRARAVLGLGPPVPLADGVAGELAWRRGAGGAGERRDA